jgi:hypothetical protein
MKGNCLSYLYFKTFFYLIYQKMIYGGFYGKTA